MDHTEQRNRKKQKGHDERRNRKKQKDRNEQKGHSEQKDPNAHHRDWMFDPVSGYLLDFTSEGAKMAATNYCRSLESMKDIVIIHRTDMEVFYRKYNLNPLVKETPLNQGDKKERPDKAMAQERCPKCNKKGLLFFTLQLRSADEGQTIFYECPECGHKYSQNS